jgi:hypothetical protein
VRPGQAVWVFQTDVFERGLKGGAGRLFFEDVFLDMRCGGVWVWHCSSAIRTPEDRLVRIRKVIRCYRSE